MLKRKIRITSNALAPTMLEAALMIQTVDCLSS